MGFETDCSDCPAAWTPRSARDERRGRSSRGAGPGAGTRVWTVRPSCCYTSGNGTGHRLGMMLMLPLRSTTAYSISRTELIPFSRAAASTSS